MSGYDPGKGEIVRDRLRDRVGRVMDREGACFQLRPLGGGVEWDAAPEDIEPVAVSAALSGHVAELNRHSAWPV
ncbi:MULTISPECIES: hypothetical protein [unclassified Streptomyces]|uniref:hypothetical protein n=1 Tax=unclassified Streptomyces TaxID=2593676 RepID=UPI00036D215D|nr:MULTISPECIES: hypothetical protein [unclassified Streptomyces]MYT33529.1 hypothetical protein [Streptomyces sp. SID8354]